MLPTSFIVRQALHLLSLSPKLSPTTPVSSRLPPISAKFSSKVQPSSIPCTITLTPVATTSTSIFDVPVPSSLSVSGNGFPTTNLASVSAALSTELSGSAPSSVVGSGSLFSSSPAATSTGELDGVSSVPGSSPSGSTSSSMPCISSGVLSGQTAYPSPAQTSASETSGASTAPASGSLPSASHNGTSPFKSSVISSNYSGQSVTSDLSGGSVTGSSPPASYPGASSETYYTTVIVDSYTTIRPVTMTQTSGDATSLLTSSTISTVYTSSTVIAISTIAIEPSVSYGSQGSKSTSDITSLGVTGSSPWSQATSETIYITIIVDTYTTVRPVTLTHTSEGITSFETTISISAIYSTSTYASTSTIVSIPVVSVPAVSQSVSIEQISSTVSTQPFISVIPIILIKAFQGATSFVSSWPPPFQTLAHHPLSTSQALSIHLPWSSQVPPFQLSTREDTQTALQVDLLPRVQVLIR